VLARAGNDICPATEYLGAGVYIYTGPVRASVASCAGADKTHTTSLRGDGRAGDDHDDDDRFDSSSHSS